jgi:hypothetical protein
MPRITAAIAAVALIVFCIGFNTARYPVVWQMVGASPHLPQPGEPSQPPTTPGPSATSPSEAATQSAASQQSTLLNQQHGPSCEPACGSSCGPTSGSTCKRRLQSPTIAATPVSPSPDAPYKSPPDLQQQYTPQQYTPQQYHEAWETAYGHPADAADATNATDAYARDAQPSDVQDYLARPASSAPADDDFVPSMSQRPLVRVVHSAADDYSAAGSFSNPAVRRLPPVDGPGHFDLSQLAPQPPPSPTTNYPSTGIE